MIDWLENLVFILIHSVRVVVVMVLILSIISGLGELSIGYGLLLILINYGIYLYNKCYLC